MAGVETVSDAFQILVDISIQFSANMASHLELSLSEMDGIERTAGLEIVRHRESEEICAISTNDLIAVANYLENFGEFLTSRGLDATVVTDAVKRSEDLAIEASKSLVLINDIQASIAGLYGLAKEVQEKCDSALLMCTSIGQESESLANALGQIISD